MTKPAELTLESLGLSQEALADRLVEKMAEGLLTSLNYDEDGYEFRGEAPFARHLNKMVKDRLNALVEDLGNKHVLPKVNEMVENLVLQETNKWGEKKGSPVSFKEYLVQRAEAYMQEKVNFEGKSQPESNSYGWSGTQTRVAHMIHQHLHFEIANAMKKALGDVTTTIAKSLHETVRIKLNEAAANMKVEVKTK